MKTNQNMIREDGFLQRTSDGYFKATELLNYYNNSHPSVENKQLNNYRKNKSTQEFINQLIKEGIDNPVITSTGVVNGGTWMHPKLFIDFAMWLSVEFKSKVIDFVVDGLIMSRNDAGDYHNQMCAQILESYIHRFGNKPPTNLYINEVNMVRNLVTDKKNRNQMTEQELKQITYLQKVNTNLISKGVGKESRIKKLKEAAEIQI